MFPRGGPILILCVSLSGLEMLQWSILLNNERCWNIMQCKNFLSHITLYLEIEIGLKRYYISTCRRVFLYLFAASVNEIWTQTKKKKKSINVKMLVVIMSILSLHLSLLARHVQYLYLITPSLYAPMAYQRRFNGRSMTSIWRDAGEPKYVQFKLSKFLKEDWTRINIIFLCIFIFPHCFPLFKHFPSLLKFTLLFSYLSLSSVTVWDKSIFKECNMVDWRQVKSTYIFRHNGVLVTKTKMPVNVATVFQWWKTTLPLSSFVGKLSWL